MEPEITVEPPVVETPVVEIPVVEVPKVEVTLNTEQQAAVNLFNALKNPETSGPTLRHLADLAGLDLAKRQDKTELKKSISQIVAEELGEDNSILAEKLGPTLEKIIQSAVDERVKPITDQISTREEKEIASAIETALENLNKETKGLSKKLETKMVELMDEISPGPKTKPEAYIRKIYKLAISDYEEAEKVKAQNVKRDVNKNTPTVHPGVNPERVKSGSRLPTIRESVEAAMRGETLE
jgi:hypothetical protein